MALLGIENGEIFAGIIGIILLIVFVIWLMKSKGGRLGEEKEEEKETDKLKKDEKEAEKAQKDEKTQCKRIRKVMDELWTLGTAFDPSFAGNKEAYQSTKLIHLSLSRLEDGKMNVQVAMETFRMLHGYINFFISQLPKNSPPIDRLVAEINQLQKRYYSDLINELEMHKKEKEELLKLWRQERDQDTGAGNLAA